MAVLVRGEWSRETLFLRCVGEFERLQVVQCALVLLESEKEGAGLSFLITIEGRD